MLISSRYAIAPEQEGYGCISVVPDATYEASHMPLKAAVSVQKALQVWDGARETRELLGGTEENSVSQ